MVLITKHWMILLNYNSSSSPQFFCSLPLAISSVDLFFWLELNFKSISVTDWTNNLQEKDDWN